MAKLSEIPEIPPEAVPGSDGGTGVENENFRSNTFRYIPCAMSGCTNDAEMICNRCNEVVCGSCFNGDHEWTDH